MRCVTRTYVFDSGQGGSAALQRCNSPAADHLVQRFLLLFLAFFRKHAVKAAQSVGWDARRFGRPERFYFRLLYCNRVILQRNFSTTRCLMQAVSINAGA